MTMTEKEYEQLMDKAAAARKKRDEDVDASQERLIDVMVRCYKDGLTLTDLGQATGISVTTIRGKFKARDISARGRWDD
jgi:hypothetical protein